jgi:predicted RNA-binding Zn ribbon-like protein
MQGVTWRLGPDAALGLLNSAHGPSAHYGRRAHPGEPAHDHLDTPARAVEFLSTHDIPAPPGMPSEQQLDRLRTIRSSIRALVDDAALDLDTWRAAVADDVAAVRFRLEPDGTLHADAAGWDAVAADLLPAALGLAHERHRMRRCGNPGCRWAFVDRSRRGDRRWCEAAVCGNRMRVGRHRRRPAGDEPGSGRGQPPR